MPMTPGVTGRALGRFLGRFLGRAFDHTDVFSIPVDAKEEYLVIGPDHKTAQVPGRALSPPVKMLSPSPTAGPVITDKPLRLDTGGHTAMIGSIAVDAKAKHLVTGSDDKTARVWQVADGVLVQTLRPPLGTGDEGKVYAVAISPDGSVVAVGGYTGKEANSMSLYLFERASGRMLRRIGGLPIGIDSLSFSLQGRYLAAGLGGENGIRVYRSEDWHEITRDTDYQDASYSVEFDRSSRLLTTSYDGYLRLYDASFKLILKQKAPGGNQPFHARFSPDGTKIAVGFTDSTAVNVLSGADLSLLYSPDTRQFNNGNLFTVAWSADGSLLYAGGQYCDATGWPPVIRWTDAGRGPAQAFRVSTDAVMDLRPLPEGRLAFGAGDSAFGVLNRDGSKQWEHRPDILDLRASRIDKLLVSKDGSQVEFSFNDYLPDGGEQTHRVSVDLNQPQPRFDASTASGLSAADTQGEEKANWYETEHPKIHGQPLALKPNEISWSLALSRQTPGFLLGTEWYLRYFDRTDQRPWAVQVPGVVWAVNLSPDGRYAIAALGDGTIRWYNTADGQEVLALYVHPDRKRWIVWTPEGFYDAAPEAESLIGYQLNQGPDHEGKFVTAKQMEQRYYRPDLIARRLSADGDRLIAEAVNSLGDVTKTLADGLPPELERLSSQLDGSDLVLEFRVKPRQGGMGRIVYTVNGVEVKPVNRDEQEARALAVVPPGSSLPMKVSLPLPAGQTNTAAVSVFNARNSISSPPLTIPPQTTPAADVKPTLYVLAVGVSRYKDPNFNLKYAAADAQAISKLLEQQGHEFLQVAPPKLLTNEQANLSSIKAAFAELAGQVKENDVFLLYLAGHGMVFDGAFHFIPQENTNEEDFRNSSLDEQGFQALLETIHAQYSLILLDTCHAGVMTHWDFKEEETAFIKLKRATGRTVLAASFDKAWENNELKHGFFTTALLNGLQGDADANRDKQVSMLELVMFALDQVPIISHHLQKASQASTGDNYPIRYLQ
jgi:WD40 repeat protein